MSVVDVGEPPFTYGSAARPAVRKLGSYLYSFYERD